MSYSLQARNAVAQMVVNQMEGQCYHGAFVIQGCDKTPMAIVARLRISTACPGARRGECVCYLCARARFERRDDPRRCASEIREIAAKADQLGEQELAEDLLDGLNYILQCASNEMFLAFFERAVQQEIISPATHKRLEKALAVNTCDAKGGICAFHGTGNSSRDVVAALGMVHPAVELLIEPPKQSEVEPRH